MAISLFKISCELITLTNPLRFLGVYWSSFGNQSRQYLELGIIVVVQVMRVRCQNNILGRFVSSKDNNL